MHGFILFVSVVLYVLGLPQSERYPGMRRDATIRIDSSLLLIVILPDGSYRVACRVYSAKAVRLMNKYDL